MTNPIVLPVSEFTPDTPSFPPSGSNNIINVFPRTKASYGAIGMPTPTYSALSSRCQGGCAYRSKLGNVYLFAGDATHLWNLKTGLTSWADVSKVGGYSIGADDQWQFTYFNGIVIATDFSNALQSFTLDTSTAFADLDGTPPRAHFIKTIKNAFVVVANTYDAVNGPMPQRLWWPAAGDPTNWPTPGGTSAAQVQAGATDLLGDLGQVQGMAANLLNADALVLMEYGAKQMTYAGPPNVFDFFPLASKGTPCPYSIVTINGVAYYVGQDGFYRNDGAAETPIGLDRVDRWFFGSFGSQGRVDLGNLRRVIGGVDPVNRLIFWAYPTPSSGGLPGEMLIYNPFLDRWSLLTVPCETLFSLLTLGYTLDQLWTVLGFLLDDLPAPLDSVRWTGGSLLMGLFDNTHTLNFLTGTPLAALVETMELQPEPGYRTMIANARPLVDGDDPSVAIGRRERLKDPVAYAPPVALNSMGACGQRRSGRYLRAQVRTSLGDANWTNISGVEIDIVTQGKR